MGERGTTTIDRQDVAGFRSPWLGVELRHLATLIAVARTGSFRGAARELGYVQSAISQQIARLERVVGTRLLERQKGQRHVTLTPTGEVLVLRGERILGELRAARIDVAHPSDATQDQIRLAIGTDLSQLLGRLLTAIRDQLPDTRIGITEVADDAELARRLESGATDVAIGGPLAAPGVASVTLLHDAFVLLVAPESDLAHRASVSSVEDLGDERLIIPASVAAQAPLHAPGLLLERALRVPLAAAVPRLVGDGLGIGLVPRSVAEHEAAPELVVVPTAGLIAPRRVILGWNAARRRTRWLGAFCDAAVRGMLDEDAAQRAAAA